jgi:hypothetical protein
MQKFCNTIEETLIQRALLPFVSDGFKLKSNTKWHLLSLQGAWKCHAWWVLCIRWSALHISRFSLFTIFHESWIQKIWRKRLRKQKIPRVITTYAREKMTYTTSSFVLDSRWKAIPNDIYFFTNALVGEELISRSYFNYYYRFERQIKK